MGSTVDQLYSLFPAEQLAQLEKVRTALLANPEALDTHKKEKPNG